MANNIVTSVSTNSVKTTVVNTSTPVVSRVVEGRTHFSTIAGISVDYSTILDRYTLVYDESSNNFIAAAPPASFDGGLFNDGTF